MAFRHGTAIAVQIKLDIVYCAKILAKIIIPWHRNTTTPLWLRALLSPRDGESDDGGESGRTGESLWQPLDKTHIPKHIPTIVEDIAIRLPAPI